LRGALATGVLSERDATFAGSLIDQAGRRAWLSDKQLAWAETLAAKAANGGKPPARTVTAVGDLSGIMALFDRAKGKLKFPAIVVPDGNGRAYRVNVAGERARVPGSLNVTAGESRAWYGRVLASGVFEASPREATPAGLPDALRAFASDPAKVAGAAGRLTGRCCFCGLAIGEGDDPRARAVGYGEVCARNWGLPFPSRVDARAATSALIAG
jgi:hypothetical protein